MALLAETLIEIQEQVFAGDDEVVNLLVRANSLLVFESHNWKNWLLFQDDDWEEVQRDDVENDQEFISSLSAAASGKPTYEHLEAIAKAFNEVCLAYEITTSFHHFSFFIHYIHISYH